MIKYLNQKTWGIAPLCHDKNLTQFIHVFAA